MDGFCHSFCYSLLLISSGAGIEEDIIVSGLVAHFLEADLLACACVGSFVCGCVSALVRGPDVVCCAYVGV